MWVVWVLGAASVAAAGLATVVVPRRRAEAERRAVAWSAARSAIDSAAISRDATRNRVEDAEHLLLQAELIAGRRGGTAAAEQAADLARRADRLWRADR